MTDPGGGSESRPIYSIGAVAGMLGVETATLRAWEERYGVVVPTRSDGRAARSTRETSWNGCGSSSTRCEAGTTPADAHRLLAERLGERGRV